MTSSPPPSSGEHPSVDNTPSDATPPYVDTPPPKTTTSSTTSYTRQSVPQRSKFKPRWHTQPYMMFLALRAMPNRTAARQEIISAAVELDKKFSAEKGLPRVFTGKTPMNSASACLTNNGDKYFIPFKPEGSRSTHFKLAYQPGDFNTAVNEYDSWMEKLIKHDWPLCFGVPKAGAVPIHILEQQEQAAKALQPEQEPLDPKDAVASDAPESRKRSPDAMETDHSLDMRELKKIKADIDDLEQTQPTTLVNTETSAADQTTVEQEIKVAQEMEHLHLQGPSDDPSFAVPEAHAGVGSVPDVPEVVASSAPAATASTTSTAQSDTQKVDEYRLEDLDLSNVPTCLDDAVRVDVSTIPNSGNGLFAKIDLPASTPLGFYFGVPMTENEFDSLKDGVGVASHYSIMYRRTVLDATDENGMPYSDPKGRLYCPFHFMNENPNGNISFITGSVVNQVICTTNRDVKAGEELFVFYGKEVDRHWAQGQEGPGSDGGDQHSRAGSRSRANSPVRRPGENAIDRPRRTAVYKPARYTR